MPWGADGWQRYSSSPQRGGERRALQGGAADLAVGGDGLSATPPHRTAEPSDTRVQACHARPAGPGA
jgi:hypothetical protein